MPSLKQTVLGAIGSRFMTLATVEKVEVVSKQFRLITLSAEKFKGAAMQPAAKIRLNAGNWDMRAYTPLSIDAVAGHIEILTYLHGDGAGSRWANSALVGDVTHVIGPQQSLDLMEFSQPAVFFGDETSLAAAKTLQAHLAPSSVVKFIFEFSNMEKTRRVVERLELDYVQCVERQTDNVHIPHVTEAIRSSLSSIHTPHLVLTGNGRSIQALRARLRSQNVDAIKYHVKAYWAPGKLGLE